MKQCQRYLVAIAVLAVAASFSGTTIADMAATYLPPAEDGPELTRMRLQASKRFGFAPMTISLSGMLETKGGNLVPLSGGQEIRLTVSSPFLQVQHSVPVSDIVSDLHYEVTTPGPVDPSMFHRKLEILKPGRYQFRVHVTDSDGTILSSNEVTVRAL